MRGFDVDDDVERGIGHIEPLGVADRERETLASGTLARQPNVLLAQIDADVTLRLERAADEVGAAATAAADLEHVAALDGRVAEGVLVEPQAVELRLVRCDDAVFGLAAEPVVEHGELRYRVRGAIVVIAMT